MLVYICSLNRGLLIPLKGVPCVVPFVGIVLLLYSIFLARTRLGRYMYAIGANPEAARRAGINVQRVRRIAFMFSAMTAGHRRAGLRVLPWGRSRPASTAATYTLYGVAAAVIGGASLFGGRGKPLHALLGGLVIAIVFNGLALMGISAAGQYIATAIVLLVAAAIDALVRRRGLPARSEADDSRRSSPVRRQARRRPRARPRPRRPAPGEGAAARRPPPRRRG